MLNVVAMRLSVSVNGFALLAEKPPTFQSIDESIFGRRRCDSMRRVGALIVLSDTVRKLQVMRYLARME